MVHQLEKTHSGQEQKESLEPLEHRKREQAFVAAVLIPFIPFHDLSFSLSEIVARDLVQLKKERGELFSAIPSRSLSTSDCSHLILPQLI
jgi:hypothetical protein